MFQGCSPGMPLVTPKMPPDEPKRGPLDNAIFPYA
jgi:hypothetical protein